MSKIKKRGRAVRAMAAGTILISAGFGYASPAAGAGRSITPLLANAKTQTVQLLSRPQQELAAIVAGRDHRQL